MQTGTPLKRELTTLWPELRNEQCTECPLHASAQSVCLIGVGPVPAKVMVIGEAPGFREDEISRPFSGRSGGLLDEVLGRYGLNREEMFITNVAKCRPEDNRTPTRTELKACRHYLDSEIEAVQPEFILLLGNSALSLLRKSGIMKHRGSVFKYGDAQVLATVHPAAVLRNPRNRGLFETDVNTFSRMVRGIKGTGHTRTYLVKDKRSLAAMCKAILKSEAIAYDLETNGFEEKAEDAKIVTLGVAVKPGLVFVVPIMHPEAPWKDPMRVLKIVGNALVYTNAKRIAHNAKFDDRWLNQFGVPVKADFDTMIAAHVLDENRPKSLKVLSPMILGTDPWAIDMSGGAAMTENLARLATYNGKDCDYTLQLYYHFRDELKREGNERSARLFAKLLMPASRALTDIERTGMWIDEERLALRRIEVQGLLHDINEKLTEVMGFAANWNSTRVISELLFNKLNLPILETTEKGAPSTRESVLLRLRHDHEAVNLILEWRKWSKYDSTYLSRWRDIEINSRIHPNYKITGTVTGRLSSGKEEGNTRGKGLNVQQVPRDLLIRSIIGAPEGWKFIEADFSQVELRIVAHYAQDPTMIRIFNTDGDIHLTTAMQITGKPADKIEKEERKKAKGVNFGFVFGMGANKFVEYARDSYDVVVTDAEAKAYRGRFFDTFSRLQPWHERQRRLALQYKRVQSAIGRVRHLPDIDSQDKDVREESQRQAINSPVQSLASDMMLMSLVTLHAQMPVSEARIVGTVHDSILFEVRDDKVDGWVKVIRDTMEHLPLKQKFGVSLSVPIRVDIKVGQHWGEGEEV